MMGTFGRIRMACRHACYPMKMAIKQRVASVPPYMPWLFGMGTLSTLYSTHYLYQYVYKLRLKELSLPEYGIESLTYRGDYTMESLGEEGILLTFRLPDTFVKYQRKRQGKRKLPQSVNLSKCSTISLLIHDHGEFKHVIKEGQHPHKRHQPRADLPPPPPPMNTAITSEWVENTLFAQEDSRKAYASMSNSEGHLPPRPQNPYRGIVVSPTQEFHLLTTCKTNARFRHLTSYDRAMNSHKTAWLVHEHTQEIAQEARRLLRSLKPICTAQPVCYAHLNHQKQHVRLALMAMMGIGQPIAFDRAIEHWQLAINEAYAVDDPEATLKAKLLKQSHVSPDQFIAYATKTMHTLQSSSSF